MHIRNRKVTFLSYFGILSLNCIELALSKIFKLALNLIIKVSKWMIPIGCWPHTTSDNSDVRWRQMKNVAKNLQWFHLYLQHYCTETAIALYLTSDNDFATINQQWRQFWVSTTYCFKWQNDVNQMIHFVLSDVWLSNNRHVGRAITH